MLHKIPNNGNIENQEAVKRHSDEEISPLYIERDVLVLEKQKTGPAQPGITPYKLFMGLLVVFITLLVVYLVTKII